MAQALERPEEGLSDLIVSYVKNQNLGFSVPYTINGEERSYVPDFIVRVNDGTSREGGTDPLNLIVEVSGEPKKDKAAKAAAARALWVPAVNNHGGFGRWAYIEIADPWDAAKAIRAYLTKLKGAHPANQEPDRAMERIRKTPGVCGGDACIRATRIPVWLLVGLRKLGSTEADLLAAYPGLSADDLSAAWRYYETHRQEIDDAIQREDADEPA